MDKKIDDKILRKERRMIWLKWGGAALAVALGGALLAGLGGKSIDSRDFTLGTASEGALETTVPATGRVVPGYEEIITSPVNSRILRVFAQPGDSVSEGMPLLELDLENERSSYGKLVNEHQIRRQELTQIQLANNTLLSELAMQIEVKEMQVNHARLDVDNERRLDSLGSGTGERVRQAETAFKAGVLELQQLREKLANERQRAAASEEVQRLTVNSVGTDVSLMERTLRQGQIPAPHAGVLTFITSDLGTQVNAGEKLAVVSDLSCFKIQGEVAEGNLEKVGIGAKVTVRIGSTPLEGTVTNITPQAKSGLVAFVVTLDDPRNSRLRSGLRVDLNVSYGYKDRVLRIPSGSYFSGPGDYMLFVLGEDGALHQRKVKLGDSNREYVEVIAGLKAGEQVTVSDMERFQTSKHLKIKK